MPTPIIVAQAEPGLLAHFPDVVLLDDGRLLATYREGSAHVRSDGRITLVDSADGGLTWGKPWVGVDGPFDDRDPKLVRLADGSVLLSFFVLDWSTKPRHTDHGTYVCRSTDGGRSWSEPAPVGSALVTTPEQRAEGLVGWSASHGAAIELPDGELLMPLYGRRPGSDWQQATVVRSTDGGRTWPADSEVLIAAEDGFHYQEPTLTVLSDGQVVALIRTSKDVVYLSRSSDGGRTWTEPSLTDMPGSSHHALLLDSGEVLVTYGDMSPRFSTHRDTVGRLVRDPAATWDGYEDIQLYDSGHSDQANPSSVEVSPGRFLTLGFDIPNATVVAVFTEPGDYPTAPTSGS